MSEELKSCPFCGQPVTIRYSSFKKLFIVEHKVFNRFCIANKITFEEESLEFAIKAWNRRTAKSADTSKMLVIELGSGGIGIAVGKSRGSTVMDALIFAELQDEHSIGAPVRANPRNVCAIIKCANIESAKVLKMQVDTIVNALDKPKNIPLTLDELREMDGESVWVSIIGENTCIENGYGLAFGRKRIVAIVDVDNWDIYSVWLNDYGKTWIAYRTKPEVVDAE